LITTTLEIIEFVTLSANGSFDNLHERLLKALESR